MPSTNVGDIQEDVMHAGIFIAGLLVASLMFAASGSARRLLDNVLDGTISWRQAVSEGLIASRCADACKDQPYGLLGPLATIAEPHTAY
jgi:hypothetical protein